MLIRDFRCSPTSPLRIRRVKARPPVPIHVPRILSSCKSFLFLWGLSNLATRLRARMGNTWIFHDQKRTPKGHTLLEHT